MSVAARARIAAAQCARWACLSVDKRAGRPSIRAKALSRTKISSAVPSTAFFARGAEDQDSPTPASQKRACWGPRSGNLTLNHISVEDRFHQPSIRPSTSTMILLCEHPGGLAHPFLISSITQRLPLDKSEGVVKTEISWAVREHRLLCQRRLRTKTLEISPESLCGGVVPPTIDST